MAATRPLAGAVAALALAGCAAPITSAEVQAVLDDQASAWNRGDLAAFVESYWDDPRLTFCGKSGVVRGRADLLATYERGYPTPQARGTLTFELLDVRPLGAGAALVLGRYQLARDEPSSGYFTLVVERTEQGLVITHDHTSGS